MKPTREWAAWQLDCVLARCVYCGVIHPSEDPAECARWAQGRLDDLLAQPPIVGRGRLAEAARQWRTREIGRLYMVLRERCHVA